MENQKVLALTVEYCLYVSGPTTESKSIEERVLESTPLLEGIPLSTELI